MAPQAGRNRWTYEQRVCLHLLWSHEHNPSLRERTRVFNEIFATHLAACRVPSASLEAKTLNCQYAERTYTHKNTWKATWENVCHPPDTDEDRALRVKLRVQISNALRRGDRANEAINSAMPLDTPPQTPRRPERLVKATQNPYEWYESHGPVTPVPQRQVHGQAHAAPIACATPGPSTRKRPAAAASRLHLEDDDDELLHDEAEYVPKAKRARRSSPRVEVSPPPEDMDYQTPRAVDTTPKRRKVMHEGEKLELKRASGKGLMLRPELHARASLPMRPVSEADAHPAPPAALFRYWHGKSHGINSDEGFTAGKFIPQRILVEPPGPPSCAHVDMNDFANHLNNSGTDQDGTPSPL